MHGFAQSLNLTVPPLSVLFLELKTEKPYPQKQEKKAGGSKAPSGKPKGAGASKKSKTSG